MVLYTIQTPYGSYRDYADFTAAQIIDVSLFRHASDGLKSQIYGDQAWSVQRWYRARQSLGRAALGAMFRGDVLAQ